MINAQDKSLTVSVTGELTMEVQTASTSNLWQVREFLANTDPELILLDLGLPPTVGADLLRIMGETFSGKRVVLRPLANLPLPGIV
jgi:response regulator of citrate/malate metabolism